MKVGEERALKLALMNFEGALMRITRVKQYMFTVNKRGGKC